MSHVETRWTTAGGVTVTRSRTAVDACTARAGLVAALDSRRGLLLCCEVSQPGRYLPRATGYTDPPVEIVARGRRLTARALNDRGRVLLPAVAAAWTGVLTGLVADGGEVRGTVPPVTGSFTEEERTRQPSVLSALRALVGAFAGPEDDSFGLWGAFGYDLILGFDPVPLRHPRDSEDRDLVLHLPDSVLVLDQVAGTAHRYDYDVVVGDRGTAGLPRETPPAPYRPAREPVARRDQPEGGYAELVRTAQTRFAVGDLFEVVPSQCFARPAVSSPAEMFERLRRRNPAPYGLLANLGDGEFLVGASPEMFVRVTAAPDGAGRRVETCPISGTVARGRDALEDSRQIRWLLESAKEESELTMCTDVDRNDKARVCVPGTVRVIGRRQIEMYSTLIHTVDHVEGRLLPDRDALDAFLTHVWAVTVTGAPKRAAVEFVEAHERSPRRWYGGAVGRVGFDGTMDTALTLRTIQVRDGVATVRAGATLLHDSVPAAEEQETVLKALALLNAVELPAVALGEGSTLPGTRAPGRSPAPPGRGLRVLLVDHEDSFVHTLADYFRQTGASVTTLRHGFPPVVLDELRPDLLVLSPGPGRPADFDVAGTLAEAELRDIPVFGVCLGLQGLVEYLGGELGVLPVPVHGKPSRVELVGDGGRLLAGLPPVLEVGRYHSLYALEATLPADLAVTARTEDGLVMAVEHRTRPLAAVQFHPESIMTSQGRHGHAVIANAVARLTRPDLDLDLDLVPAGAVPAGAVPVGAVPVGAAAGRAGRADPAGRADLAGMAGGAGAGVPSGGGKGDLRCG